MHTARNIVLATALTFGLAAPAFAQSGEAEVNRIINELAPSQPGQAATESYQERIKRVTVPVRPDIDKESTYRINSIIEERDYVLNYNHTEDFTVNFRFDSFAITPRAKRVLDTVGQALTDPRLKGETYLVGGHTDTVGSDAYNQWLSEKRANAVVNYLVESFGIDRPRLQPVGFGETELADPRRGANRANRRVEFTLIQPVARQAPPATAGVTPQRVPNEDTGTPGQQGLTVAQPQQPVGIQTPQTPSVPAQVPAAAQPPASTLGGSPSSDTDSINQAIQ
ncbi:MAG: OmpA family protein [Devosia sp.]